MNFFSELENDLRFRKCNGSPSLFFRLVAWMIAIAQATIVALLVAVRLRWALCAFLFFLAFAPRSLGLELGAGSALTFARLSLPIIFVGLFFNRLGARNEPPSWRGAVLQESPFLVLLALATTKIAGTVLNGVAPVHALDDFLFSVGVFYLFYRFSGFGLYRGVLKASLLALLVSSIFVLIEYPLSKPLHFSIINPMLLEDDVLRIRVRDGMYRAQAIFDNPLSFAEFLVYATPVVGYMAVVWKRMQKFFYFILFLVLPVLVASTGSRGGILAFLGVILVFFAARKWHRLSPRARVGFGFLLAIFSLFSVAYAVELVSVLSEQAKAVEFYLQEETQRSTNSRALQYFEVIKLVSERPLFGVGVHQNFSNQFVEIHRLDNYYLRVVLEAGVIGLLLFLGFLGLVLRKLVGGLFISSSAGHVSLVAMGLSVWFGFVLMKFFLSMPTNNVYFYAFMGLILGLCAQVRKREAVCGSC